MINKEKIKHIVISRTDNIGDVILTLPIATILKEHFPDVKITFLAREYVRAVVEHCDHVDAFLSWDALSCASEMDAVAQIQAQSIDAVIHAFPKKIIAQLMKRAKIKYRIGTTRRLYHWLTCNERVNFTRARSTLHEAQLNCQLLKPFQISSEYSLEMLRDKIALRCEETVPLHLQAAMDPNRFNLIVHPFTNGNTREWPVSHFIALIRQLPADRFNVILTGSKKESEIIQNRIVSQCPDVKNVAGQCSLDELLILISHSDGLIANSTGPLHIAAGLGVYALGLFPMTKGMDVGRWGPLGKKAEVICANSQCQSPQCRGKQDCFCMESITVEQVKNKINRSTHFSSAFKQGIK